MKSDDLSAIVDFLYRGEANVFQENLDSFLAIAEELQLKGLMGKTDDRVEDLNEKHPKAPTFATVINTNAKIPKNSLKGQFSKCPNPEENRTVAIPHNFSTDLQELDERVKSMMEKSQNFVSNQNKRADICKVCGKEGQSNGIKDHIEANHLEGIILPCSLCDKTFRSRNSLRHHNRQKCVYD